MRKYILFLAFALLASAVLAGVDARRHRSQRAHSAYKTTEPKFDWGKHIKEHEHWYLAGGAGVFALLAWIVSKNFKSVAGYQTLIFHDDEFVTNEMLNRKRMKDEKTTEKTPADNIMKFEVNYL
eukprot:983826_1